MSPTPNVGFGFEFMLFSGKFGAGIDLDADIDLAYEVPFYTSGDFYYVGLEPTMKAAAEAKIKIAFMIYNLTVGISAEVASVSLPATVSFDTANLNQICWSL